MNAGQGEDQMPATMLAERTSGKSRAALSPVDLRRMWATLRSTGDSAVRTRLIEHYMKAIVVPAAHTLRRRLPPQIDVNDLVQQGFFGLIWAMNAYEPGRGASFATFARKRINGAMLDGIRAADWVPRSTRQHQRQVEGAIERFVTQHGRRPSHAELFAALGLSRTEFNRVMRDFEPARIVHPTTTSEHSEPGRDADGPQSIIEALPDKHNERPAITAERNDLRRWMLRGLTREQRLIVVLYFYEQLSMREIGITLGISESRVSQLLKQTRLQLRARLSRGRDLVTK